MCSCGKEQLVDGKKIVIGGGYKDGEIVVFILNGVLEFIELFVCFYEEVDIRLFLYVKYVLSFRLWVIIQLFDIDVLVLCVIYFESIGCEEFWFKIGV